MKEEKQMKKECRRKRSYLAMVLSLMIPGLGQLYLRRPGLALLLFIGVVSGGMLIYFNSYPVSDWSDITRLESPSELLFVGRIGDASLMFRPLWPLKITGLIQLLLFWCYAVLWHYHFASDGHWQNCEMLFKLAGYHLCGRNDQSLGVSE
jgi:hypothetical protein